MIVLPFQTLFTPDIPPSTEWKNAGWEVQPPQPPSKPKTGAGAMIATGLVLVLTDPSVVRVPVFDAWEVQAVQPLHPRIEKAGALALGDTGTQAAVINWINAGREVQPLQPPHPRPERSGALAFGDAGTEAVFVPPVVVIPAWGWEPQSVQPPAYPSVRQRYAGIKGRLQFGVFLDRPAWGFEPQIWQPPHSRPEKSGALAIGDSGIEARFVFAAPAPAWGWEVQSVQPRVYPTAQQRYIGTKGKSQFGIFYDLQPMDWVVPFTPRHPRTEKAGALASGDTGTEAPFIPSAPPVIAWGWETKAFQPRAYPTLRQRASGAAGESMFAASQLDPFGWEVQLVQPPRPRVERRGAIFTPVNTDAVFVQTPVPFTSPGGFEFQPLTSRFVFKGGVIAKGDDGTQGRFVNWRNAGSEIQPWQPPHPRPERSAAWLLGDSGIEAPYVFVAPPPLSPWGYEVQSHVFFKRPVGSALAGAININAVYVFVPPPPPPPPSPIPVQFRSKVFAVNCAQGNTNVAVSSETNVFNPVTVGMSITLVVSSGNSLPPNTPGQTLIITKPDGTVIRLTYPDAFIGTLDTMTDVGLFLGGTYLVGGVYLDQAGFWSVQVVKSPVATALGLFFVSPA